MATTFEATRAEALFLSWLQPSHRPTADEVRTAISTTLRGRGVRGCASAVAAEYGEHPDIAPARMSWALSTVRAVYASRAGVRAGQRAAAA